jgi:hypothetical protein
MRPYRCRSPFDWSDRACADLSDHPLAPRQKKHHLGVPVISRQRTTMMEKDRLAGTPIGLNGEMRVLIPKKAMDEVEKLSSAAGSEAQIEFAL